MVDPTPQQLAEWQALSEVATWAGLQGDPTNKETPAGSLFALLGAEATTPVRTLGAITESDYTTLLDKWKLGESDPSPIQRSAAALRGRATRVAAGTQETEVQAERDLHRN